MKFTGLSLAELAAVVAGHLQSHGVEVVVVGGSAITLHLPDVYTSMDIDFAATSGIDHRRITLSLDELGFRRDGRVFVHPESPYAIDFVADRPYIDQRPVYDFAEIRTASGTVRVLHLEDAIADRVAAFLYWSDSQSLDVAERSVVAARDRLAWERLDASLDKLDTALPDAAQRMALARERLRRAVAGS
ncbi:MAG TPA: hypothetical protein VGX97_07525 [bacterium]|nr:hypothetical protein [bacterium]